MVKMQRILTRADNYVSISRRDVNAWEWNSFFSHPLKINKNL